MEHHCPSCTQPIGPGQINITQGVAFCPACATLSRLDAILHYSEARAILDQPPTGCTVSSVGRDIALRVSLRSWRGAITTLGICLFWNGLLSVFLLLIAQTFLHHLLGGVPEWFPSLESQKGPEPDGKEPMALGGAIFLLLFMTGHIIIGVCMLIATLLSVAGKAELLIVDEQVSLRTSAGPLSWTRRFDREKLRRDTNPNAPTVQDAERTPITVPFSSFLQGSPVTSRLLWLAAAVELLTLTPPERFRELIMRVGEKSRGDAASL